MSTPLKPWQCEVLASEDDESGAVFGLGCPIDFKEFDPGEQMARTDDVILAGRSGRTMGVDLEDAPSWQFSMFTSQDAYNSRTALHAWRELSRRWPAWPTVSQTNKLQVLRYNFDYGVRRVYGRPRNKAPKPTNMLLQGLLEGSMTFDLADPRSFSDEVSSVNLSTIPMAPQGRRLPAKLPWRSVGSVESLPGLAKVLGYRETPVWIQVDGPTSGFATNLTIRCASWSIGVARIGAGDSILIDARPWVTAAVRLDGSGAASALAPGARISGLSLPPGVHTLSMSGTDPTGTTRATVSWRDAEAIF